MSGIEKLRVPVMVFLAAIGAFAAFYPALAQTPETDCCVIMPGVPTQVPVYQPFAVTATDTYNCSSPLSKWVWRDGFHDTDYVVTPPFIATPYRYQGTYTWELALYDSRVPPTLVCAEIGLITVTPPVCTMTCAANLPKTAATGETIHATATATLLDCYTTQYFQLAWGDLNNTIDIDFDGTGNFKPFSYQSPGVYHWTMTASTAPCIPGCGVIEGSCTTTGTITIALPQPCLTVGSLKFCADTITPPTPQGNAIYTFQGNASVNGTLFATQDCTFTGDPATGTGTFATRGDVYMKRPAGNKTVFTGPDLAFQVNGTDGILQMDDAHISANPYYTYAPNGLTLRNTEGWLNLFTGGLSFPAMLYIGQAGRMPLGSLRTVFQVPSSGPVTLGATMVVEGALQPGFVVTGASLAYDEATGAEGTLGGTVDLNFPDLGPWQVRGDLAVENGCINRIHVPPFSVTDLSFGNGGYQFQNSLEITLTEICDPVAIQARFLSALVGKAGGTKEQYSIADADLVFIPPSAFMILDGQMKLACEMLTDLDGEIFPVNVGGPPYDFLGNMKAFWWDGNWRFNGVEGKGKGTYKIPLDYCRGDFEGSLARCMAGLTQAKSLGADSPPCLVGGSEILLDKDPYHPHWILALSELKLKGGSIVATVNIKEDCSHVFSNLGGIWEGGLPAMHGRGESAGVFTVPVGLERASFAAVGVSAVPTVTLQMPSGGTITPQNAASFPGVLYRGDPDTSVALFTVLSPEAGTWTLSSDLAPPDVTLLGSMEAFDPSVAVISANKTGEQVSISGSVIPGSAATLVDVVYASSPGGLAEGTVASGLPATNGTISAVWDTSLVPNGSYYIGLSAYPSGGYPVEAWSSVPVVVNHGGPAPPADLTGTRAGDSVILTWTPSVTPGVTGYLVKYTAAPSAPGYTSWTAAASPQGTTVSGLDPGKNYRFAAVAVDPTGALSLESASFTTASCAVACAGSAPDSVQAGQPAAFAAHVSSEHCSGAVAYDWDFGDGSAHSAQENPAHTFADPGSYAWTLTVSSGGVSSACTGLTYAVPTPVCSLTCSTAVPPAGKVGQPVAFASSVQKPGCVLAERVTWNFGDGAVSAEASPSHAYAAPGQYSWSFTVNADGFSCLQSGLVHIAVATPGDCDGNGTVSIGEVQKAINMFLGTMEPGCGVDCNSDGTISIGEVQKVINGFLGLSSMC